MAKVLGPCVSRGPMALSPMYTERCKNLPCCSIRPPTQVLHCTNTVREENKDLSILRAFFAHGGKKGEGRENTRIASVIDINESFEGVCVFMRTVKEG